MCVFLDFGRWWGNIFTTYFVVTTTTAFSAILAWMGGRRLPGLGSLGIFVAFAGVVIVVNNSLSSWTLALGNIDGALFWVLFTLAAVPMNAHTKRAIRFI